MEDEENQQLLGHQPRNLDNMAD